MRKSLKAIVPICSLVLLLIFFFYSCRKTDVQIPETFSQSETEKKFFQDVERIDPRVNAIKENIKRKNNKERFIDKFVGYAGYPIWHKARVSHGPINTTSNRMASEGDQVIYIPFAKPENHVIGAILEAWISDRDTVYNTLYHWQYEQYGFEAAQEYDWDARDIFNLFASFQRSVYGNSKFRINDGRLFGIEKDQPLVLTYRSSQQSAVARYYYAVEECVIWDICIPYLLAKTSSMAGDPMCYLEFQIEICTTYYYEIGGGGGGSGGGGDPGGGDPGGGGGGGGGSGGTGGGGDPWDDPCRVMREFENPCGGGIGWTPIDEITDPNGFLYSRIAELEQKIAQDPYILLECDELNIMPLEDQGNGFGNMYKRIAQFNPPQSVLDRLDQLEQTTLFNFDDFYVQDIDDASGTIVNCDFFAVRIQQLPTGWTQEMLVEHFRKNINTFITPPVNVNFQPYVDNGINDTQL